MNLKTRVFLPAMLALSCCYSQAWAADPPAAYPNKPIRIVVPFSAGGPSDVMARSLAQVMTREWGQPVVVDNRVGASGIIGVEAVTKSAADGYTLLLSQVGDAISVSLYSKLPYNFEKDLAPITLAGQTPFILVAHPSVPARDLRELIALAKAKPGTLSFGSSGAGTASHLAGEQLKSMAGIDILLVPYKGQAPATADLLGGQITMMFNNPITSLSSVKAGKLRALAVSTAKRFSQLPEVPTVAESGLPGFDVGFWLGALAPAGTPRPIVDKLNGVMVKALRDPEVVERLAALGVEIIGNSPDEYTSFIHADVIKWAKVVKASGAKAD
ncbi:MAG TPA: tripartite tricarboxylate transporter substrate binding protein [Burkholderiales bacterium]|jgi:tripartite-type tricarboxylate transporter receptor subunit TctC|nr:tripartite tricarboxylate transporter substrate binding protein [Burkholderiales bacterium]